MYMSELSIVVPVFNEEKAIGNFLSEVRLALEKTTSDYEIIFAMDPSSDRTEEMIVAEHEKDHRIKLLCFSRRFGQPSATWAGLAHSSGQAVIVIDCDLQDPPDLIPEMFRLWKEEGYKVVIPQRRSREGDHFIKKTVAYIAYWFINKTATVEIPRNAGDYRLLDRRVVDELMQLSESNSFLRGLTAVVGFKTILLPFDRRARVGGAGKYPVTGGIFDGLNGVVGFSGFLLRMLSIVGFFMAALAMFAALLLPLVKLLGWWDFATGLTTLGVMLLFLQGCQFMGLGILGAYIGRIYEETKSRPKFIIEKMIGFKNLS
jgi:dolichol-phosphate mannosyltransferase